MAIQFDGKADNIADMLNVSLWCAKYSGNTVNHEYIVPIQCSCIYRLNHFIQFTVISYKFPVIGYKLLFPFVCWSNVYICNAKRKKKQRCSFVLKWIINKRRLCAICNMQSALEIYVYYIFTTIFLEPIETTVKCLDDKTKQCVYMYVICGRQTNRRSRKKIISQKI